MPKKIDRTGEENITKEGYKVKIIRYGDARDIDIEFEDGHIIKNRHYKEFKEGSILKYGRFIDRTGEKSINNSGIGMKINKYVSAREIYVEFDDGTVVKSTYKRFKEGGTENPNMISVYGVGRVGQGEHKPKDKSTGKFTKAYTTWFSMMNRCYSEKFHKKEQTYKDCEVCEEWKTYQNYANWFYENYETIGEEPMELDKDILHKGNKLYSPNNCIFVPKRINSLFRRTEIDNGLPVGVSIYNGQFKVSMNKQYLGLHPTSDIAFNAYKQAKEAYIKEVANTYVSKYPNFPKQLYNAMINYEVEITD